MTHKKCSPGLIHICLLTAVILTLAAASAEWKEKVLYSFQGGVWHNAGRRAADRCCDRQLLWRRV
jgi:hypothetical protein